MSEPTRLDGDLHVKGSLRVDGKGGLPEVTEADNGMVLGVDNGEWAPVAGGGGGSDAVLVLKLSTLGIPKVGDIEDTYLTLGDNQFQHCYLYDGDLGDLGTLNAPKVIMLVFDEDTPPAAVVANEYQWETFPAADLTRVSIGTLCNAAETQAILFTPYDEQYTIIPANTALAEGTMN